MSVYSWIILRPNRLLAQLVARRIPNPLVGGSSPSEPAFSVYSWITLQFKNLKQKELKMSRMSLRKALKVKKNLSGEIGKIRATITKYNSQEIKNPHIDVGALLIDLDLKNTLLINLKSAIAVQNVSIYPDIIAVEEIKGLIAFYEGLDTTENSREVRVTPNGREMVDVVRTVEINLAQKNNIVKSLQLQLESTLEKIDDYNSSHYVEVEGL